MPRVLLLDVMGTLVHDPWQEAFVAALGMPVEAWWPHKDPHAWKAFERGELDEATLAGRMFTDGRVVELERLRTELCSRFRLLPGIEALLDDVVAAGLPMAVLSNYSCWYVGVDEAVGISRWIPTAFVSFRTGVRKPDPEAYRGAARGLGVAPSDVLFVDDRQKNVDGALAVGMRSVLFRDAAMLRATLGL